MPLVLHGVSSVSAECIRSVVAHGISKINVGSVLKRTYFETIRSACMSVPPNYNPYEVMGSGLERDVLTAGRIAVQKKVQELMRLFGSAGRV